MNSSLRISVIIPVFNAAQFLERAVLSALQFDQIAEVILVEDGSKDNSMEVCRQLQQQHTRVKLYVHPNGENKGAGPSRNLGVQKAQSPWLAFLDADDIFLPNRFDAEENMLSHYPDIDGVYGALGVEYFSEQGKQDYYRVEGGELTTVKGQVEPIDLKWVLLDFIPGKGFFSIDTLTVKREAVIKAGMFPKLRLHQDTVFLIRLAFMFNLHGGILDRPVGLRGVHDNNRITKNKNIGKTRVLMYDELLDWARQNNYPKDVIQMIEAKQVYFKIMCVHKLHAFGLFLTMILSNPIFRRYTLFFNPAVHSLFGNKLGHFIMRIKEFFLVKLAKKDSSNQAFFALLKSVDNQMAIDAIETK